MIDNNKISELVNKIAEGYNPEKIILFGSYAKGTANEDSDVDLLVIKDSNIPRPERTFQVRKMLYGMMIPIDILVYTPIEIKESQKSNLHFLHEVLSTGKIVYERNA
ncbi:MAG TPA: nucleotidyltransferase domain-containing protein [Bacteroidales bacterium]|nr:MAG: Nucleotidyltransferase domain protein [Bacteroidetes bacterium ADurb.Bin217]HPM12870.1 nucleotidyltransferase domain-containing protein [Bacteroidales bacterium]